MMDSIFSHHDSVAYKYIRDMYSMLPHDVATQLQDGHFLWLVLFDSVIIVDSFHPQSTSPSVVQLCTSPLSHPI